MDRSVGRLDHPLKERVEQLRTAILDSNEEMFPLRGRTRVRFRLFPEDRVQLVFHRGSEVKGDAGDFAFDDDTGLLR